MGVAYVEHPGSTDSVDAKLTRNTTRRFTAESDLDLSAVLLSLMFSTDNDIYIGTPHPDLDILYCTNISTTRDENSVLPRIIYTVEVTYSNNLDSGGASSNSTGGSASSATAGQQQGVPPEDRQTNPLFRPVDIRISNATQEMSCLKAYRVPDGKIIPYVNTVGDAILPPLTRSAPTSRITIGRNNLIYPGNLVPDLGKINDRDLVIPIMNASFPKWSLKFTGMEAEPVYENGISYWRITLTIEMGTQQSEHGDYYGWIKTVANMGKREFADAGKSTKILTDQFTGQPLTEPDFLTEVGTQINKKDANGNYNPNWVDSIHYLKFRPDSDFNMAALWT
jgi:hypothetical protein